jgi:DNA-binding NtrC family response regulator
VGGTEPIKVDVRIIAATNRNLDQLMQEGKFREDLYYRLKVIPIVCPPLRERRDDIEELALHFMRKAGLASGREVHNIDAEALDALKSYRWPGNVRQLEWAIERAVVLGESDRLELQDLPPETSQAVEEASFPETAVPALLPGAPRLTPVIPETTWEEHEKAKITEALQRTNGNITRAAQLLGMSFRTLQYRLEKFGIRKQ